MNEFFATYGSELISAIGGLVTGALGGSFLTMRWTRDNRINGNGRVVDQSKSRVKGDMVGGNKTINRDRSR